jgi:replication factor C subunit 2/4
MSRSKNDNDTLPWIEKYRPENIESIYVDKQIKNQIKKMIYEKNCPNLILEGSPGVGKTSTIKCTSREIYGNYYKYMVLEMNASDDRGIKIQDTIENFRKTYVHIKDEDINKVAKFKMVILDEADNMTDKAKHIISSFIKKNYNDIRFVFTCNTKVNIISAIQSGCHIIKYPPLSDDIILKQLTNICELEGLIKSKKNNKKIKKGLTAITKISNGDMRHAINILQLTHNRFKSITEDNVYEIYDRPHPQKSKDIIMLCYNNDLSSALQKIIEMRKSGYSGTDIALGLTMALRLDICDIPENIKIDFWKCISYSLYNISKGLDASLLQISACIADMCKITLNKENQKVSCR